MQNAPVLAVLAVLAGSYDSGDRKNWDGGKCKWWHWGWEHWSVGCGDKEC